MDLSHLIGKRIVSAWTVPSCEILFLVDDLQQLYELTPGDVAKRTKAIRCFIAVEGTHALRNGTVEKAGPLGIISQPVQDSWASISEAAIVTDKGTCRITTAIFNAKQAETCPLFISAVKGYPPQESVSLADFARCFEDKQNDGQASLRKKDVQGVQSRVSPSTRGSTRTLH
jgi:hypothetical protein